MKIVRLILLLAAGLLVLAGCSSPVLNSLSRSGALGASEAPPEEEPITINISFGNDTAARSAAGYTWDQLATANDIKTINTIQLVVVDADRKNNDPWIVWVDEKRRTGPADTALSFNVQNVIPNHQYAFLLLMGQWERDKQNEEGNIDYVYRGSKPTLLKAGFIKQTLATQDSQISIKMKRPRVDTKFVTVGGSGDTKEPVKVGNQIATGLTPRNWQVKWTLQWTENNKDALQSLLDAEKIITSVSTVSVAGKRGYYYSNTAGNTTPDSIDNVTFDGLDTITMNIGDHTQVADIGKPHAVNFRLDYTPFNLINSSNWTGLLNSNLWGSAAPIWYIRNGVNNEVQNADTDFGSYAINDFTNTKNGNGAVVFVVQQKTVTQPANNLTIAEGGKLTDTGMLLTPGGWMGDAPDVYYYFGETKPTDYSDYKKVTPKVALTPGGGEQLIPKDNVTWVSETPAWVVLVKDGEFGTPVKLITNTGNAKIDVTYGDDDTWQEWGGSEALKDGTGQVDLNTSYNLSSNP
jgi:hypothetical protein